MSKKNTPPSIDDLLASTPSRRTRTVIAKNEPLAQKIREFLDLKAARDERVQGLTLRWFYEKKLQAAFDGPKWFGTVRKYVEFELKRDIDTGAIL